MKDGFLKVAAAAPEIRVADPAYNTGKIIDCIADAKEQGVKLLTFPELVLTGATCGHLYFQRQLTDAAMDGLRQITVSTQGSDMLVVVGLPLAMRGAVYSAAAVICNGEILGFTARRNVRGTQFTAVNTNENNDVNVSDDYYCCIESEMLYVTETIPGLAVGVQFAADRALAVPPTAMLCTAGATVIAELSDAPMSSTSRRDTMTALEVDTRRLHYGCVSAAPSSGESTTDKSYYGLCLVTDDGETLSVSENGSGMAVSELDIFNLNDARMREQTYADAPRMPIARYTWELHLAETRLTRRIKREPFVPDGHIAEFAERCLTIQATGLIKRMEYTNCWRPVIGVSGGVDSTLVMLACAKAMDICGLPRKNIVAVTMPCFGTTDRTKNNAITIAEQLGACRARVPAGDQPPTPETLALSAQRLRALAADHPGLRVLTENWKALLVGAETTRALLERLEGEVGLLIDTGNWDGPDKYAQIAAVAGGAECSQVKVRESSPGVLDAEDISRSLAALAQAGYSGRLSLVYAGSDDDEWGRLEELHGIVRTALG